MKKTVKYLGVILDTNLNFDAHIDQVINKSNIALKEIYTLINKNSPLDKNLKLLLYKQCIRPIFLYACPVWSNTSQKNIRKLQIIQNKFLRVALNKPYSTRISELHQNISTIKDEIAKQTKDFYTNKVKILEKTKDIGQIKTDTCPFKIKHKLINHLLL